MAVGEVGVARPATTGEKVVSSSPSSSSAMRKPGWDRADRGMGGGVTAK